MELMKVSDILVTIPLGMASDYGYRRLVLCLNVGGLSAMFLWIVLVGYLGDVFATKAMLFGPLFSLLGGGECVLVSTMAAVVTEIAPDEARRYVSPKNSLQILTEVGRHVLHTFPRLCM